MKKILFQGDSITDACRIREADWSKGFGYPNLVSAELGVDFPNDYECFNKGIAGNRIVDLYARIKEEAINLKPDIMSILVGVNDVWAELQYGGGTDTAKFEKIYNMMIEEIKTALPDVKLMILEPFLLHGVETDKIWDEFRAGVEEKAAAVKRVAEAHNIKFIPLMKKFDEAAEIAPPSHWSGDGVHPSESGHELIKREWMKAFKEL